jgi:hypothetical protein
MLRPLKSGWAKAAVLVLWVGIIAGMIHACQPTEQRARDMLKQANKPTYAVRTDAALVFIWIDADAAKAGFKLMADGAAQKKPGLLAPYLACIVNTGTRISVVDGGFFSSTVVVSEGPKAGCQGYLENEMIKETRG